ncbi:MAG TPA: hypothetical protein VFS10_09170 [Pyrinomonadaceae bacterium]|nr:hypothetical protein [Pyrinomonadaceae bacterium]
MPDAFVKPSRLAACAAGRTTRVGAEEPTPLRWKSGLRQHRVAWGDGADGSADGVRNINTNSLLKEIDSK